MNHARVDRPSAGRRDDGFTVIEVAVAIALVTIVMTSLAGYFVTSGRVTDEQGRRQAAVHVALTAMEKARSLSGVGLATGRSKARSDALAANGKNAALFPGVDSYLRNPSATSSTPASDQYLTTAYDTSLPSSSDAGADPDTTALPTGGVPVTLGKITFTQNWFLSWCLRTGDTCAPTSAPNAANTFVQVVVAVTWPGRNCPDAVCSLVSSSLVSETPDPIFDQSKGAPKPKITNPGDQSHEVGQPVNLPVLMTGGTPAFAWTTPPALPAGLSWGNSTTACPNSPAANPVCIVGTPTTVTPTGSPVAVTLKVTDSFDYVSTALFSWTITPGPTLAPFSPLTSDTNDATNLTATATSGTAPYVYSATGLPSGVTISASTGKVTGTPSLGGVYNVAFKVVDKYGVSDTKSMPWTVNIAGEFVSGGCNPTSSSSQTCTGTYTVYGDGPFTWTITRADTNTTIQVSSDTKTARFTSTAQLKNHPTYVYRFTATQTKTGATWTGGYSIASTG